MFEKGCYILVVSEPRFRRFYKLILKLFVNDFEIFFFMTCIAFAYKDDVTLTRILLVLIG